MPKLTDKQKELLMLKQKGGNDAHLLVLEKVNSILDNYKKDKESMEEKFEKGIEDLKRDMPNLDKFLKSVKGKQGDKGDRGDKGDKGDRGLPGEDGINGTNGIDGMDGIDGLDAEVDVDAIVEEASNKTMEEIEPKIPKIEDIKNDLPKLGDQIRNALELLKGDDRLDVSAIKGLDKLLNETMLVGSAGASNLGFSFFVDDEVPAGTINGTNKDFTINNTPSPATSLRVFVNGQKMTLTEDYTYTNQTITFVTAPPTTSVITVDYRV